MPQSFTLLFGSKTITAEVLAEQLESLLSVNFRAKSSMYLGDYYHYEGAAIDKLSIRENFVPGFGLAESDHREFPILLYAYFFSGTEEERIARFLKMRETLMKVNGLELIRDLSPEADEEED